MKLIRRPRKPRAKIIDLKTGQEVRQLSMEEQLDDIQRMLDQVLQSRRDRGGDGSS